MEPLQKLIIGISLILLTLQIGWSQSEQAYFERITTEHGLSQNDVNCILQDSKGFLWFGTNDGLNRYDGYDFKLFKPELGNPFSIQSNLILSLEEDNQGRIWVGSAGAGLSCFDPRTLLFHKFLQTSDSIPEPIDEHIIDIHLDEYDQLWVATLHGVELFSVRDIESNSAKNSPKLLRQKLPTVLNRGRFSRVSPGIRNSLWVGGDRGLFKLNRIAQENQLYQAEQIQLSMEEERLSINDITPYLSKAMLFATGDGLVYMPESEINRNNPKNNRLLAPGIFGEIEVDKHQQIWGGTPSGLAQFRTSDETLLPELVHIHRNDVNIPNSLSKDVILSLTKDNFGLIWVGTNGGGVNKFDQDKTPFTHIKKNLQPGSISYDKIRSVFEDSKGNLWMGTEGGGLNFLAVEKQDGRYQKFKNLPVPENVFALTEVSIGKKTSMFLGGQANPGLFKIKIPEPGEAISNIAIKSFAEIPHSVFSLLNDSNEDLWVGTYNGGLFRMDISRAGQDSLIQHYRHDPAVAQSLSSDIIRSLLKDSKGNIWIGTGKGLNRISSNQSGTSQSVFNIYYSSAEDSLSISHNYILALYESKAGEVWIGTFGGGLNKWVPDSQGKKGHFTRFTEKDGLSDNVVKGILEDEWGHLWLATNKGLSRFDPQEKSFKNYDTHDGLQSKEFSELACWKRESGEMIFGGVNGFNAFFPGNIAENTSAPKVVFTDFEVVNKPISAGEELHGRILLDKAISEINHIELKHTENSFSFSFAALHYSAPGKNQYKYMLKGFDEDWITANSQKRFATYTNLEPGDYELFVKASNSDGYWNEEPASISIEIAPPYWRTWYAYLFYAILLIGLLIAVQLYTFIGIKEKHALVLEHLAKERREELNQLKLQFFTNISHELRTPLTLISGPMDYLINSGKGLGYDEREYQYQLIRKNTDYLLRLVNQLLDFRKIDRGKTQLKVQEGDISGYIQEISEPFQFIANKKEIEYQVHLDSVPENTWFDPGIIEKVLYNLLSNAFKFTPKQGAIKIELSMISSESGQKKTKTSSMIEIRVRDTGSGISHKNLKNIFERYYKDAQQVKVNAEGAGIGLAYTKSLVELHKGTISVESEEGKGSTFTVCIPIGSKSYEKSEKVKTPQEINKAIDDPLTYLSDLVPEKDPREEVSHTSSTYKPELPYLLIIDDNESIRDFLRKALQKEYNIAEAKNGQEGLSLAKEIIPDLVICDVVMPVMDGIEFTREVKIDAKTSHIPVVLLTANPSEQMEIEGLQIGVDDYMRKPFNLQRLKVKLQSILKQRLELKEEFKRQMLLEPEVISVTSTDEAFLKKAMDLIEEHMTDPNFNVENMVHEIGMSRSKLYLKLKALTGQSSSEFIRTVRLKRAVQLLESSDLTVKEIMYMTGFNTASYFSKCFKRQFGISPSEYVRRPKVNKV